MTQLGHDMNPLRALSTDTKFLDPRVRVERQIMWGHPVQMNRQFFIRSSKCEWTAQLN